METLKHNTRVKKDKGRKSMRRLKDLVVFIVWSGTLLLTTTQCGPSSEPTFQSTPVPSGVEVVNITETETVTTEITQQKVFDQCESRSPFKASIQLSQSNSQETQRELVLVGKVGGEVGVSAVAKVALETEIEQHFINSEINVWGREEGVDIEVPSYTKQEYIIIWRESRREGTVQYLEDGETKTASYSYRIGLELVSTTGRDLLCPEPEQETGGAITAPTRTPRLTNTPRATATRDPTPTRAPVDTPTPIGMVNEVHQIDGERTAGDNDGEATEKSWYSTDIYVQTGDYVSIDYISGEWWVGKVENSEWVPQIPTNADGYTGRVGEQVIAQLQAEDSNMCFELRSAPIGSLIGRIGESGGKFSVGNSLSFIAEETGILFLRMNYNCRRRYMQKIVGRDCPILSGGSISVRVIVTPP